MSAHSGWSAGAHRGDVNAIENDIEETRRDLDDTLSALQLRLSPRRRLEDASAAARRRFERVRSEGVGFARRHPEPLVSFAVCLAIGLVVRAVLSHRQR